MNGLGFSRRPVVLARLGIGKTKHDEDEAKGLLPPRVSIGGHSVAWVNHELDAVLAALAVGARPTEVKDLVSQLVEARARLAGMSADQIRSLAASLVARVLGEEVSASQLRKKQEAVAVRSPSRRSSSARVRS